MQQNPEIKKLREGDTVLFYPRSVLSPPKEVKVEKVTRTRVVVGGVSFDRKKGYACGHGQDPFPPAILIVAKKGTQTSSPFVVSQGKAVLTAHPFASIKQIPDADAKKLEKAAHSVESALNVLKPMVKGANA